MFEVVISSLILGIAMTATLQVLGWIALERKTVERRQCAIQEVANLMERITALPWNELTEDRVGKLTLSEPARAMLPGAELTVSVDEAADPAPQKRLAVRLRWRDRAGGFERPVRLSAWTFPRRSKP